MQGTWNQWGAQAATGVPANVSGFSMPPPTTAAVTAAAGTAAAVTGQAAALSAFPMGAYPFYNPQAALNPAVAAGAGGMAAGYTPQQWAMAQQQNWQQWEQWQQQYAQWQQQYGEKYQAHMNATMGVGATAATAATTATTVMATPSKPPPPLPASDPQQPPPPTSAPVQPPVPQTDRTSSVFSGYSSKPQVEDSAKRPFDGKDDKDDSKKMKLSDKALDDSKSSKKETLEELAEAEKAFDLQFKNWESQFLRWKEQNINHPDKSQYKEYEAKWESWREQLLERREQMKKRREAKEASIKAAEAAASAASLEAKASAAAELHKDVKNNTAAITATPASAANVNMVKPGMSPAMFPINPALATSAAMAGFPPTYGYPGYGAFPGMGVPPPVVPPPAAQMAQFPGMSTPVVNPETNSAPLDFLKPSNKGIPGLDLVGQDTSDDSKGDNKDQSKSTLGKSDYSSRDLNKPLTTSDDKPFQFLPPVSQMPPYMQPPVQSFPPKPLDVSSQVSVPPPFTPNMVPPGQFVPGAFSGPPPDNFSFSADGPPPTMGVPGSIYGAGGPQMYGGPQSSAYPGPNSFNSSDPSKRDSFDSNKANDNFRATDPYGSSKSGRHDNSFDSPLGPQSISYRPGSDPQSGGSDNFRSQQSIFGSSGPNLFEPPPGSQLGKNQKGAGLLPTPLSQNKSGWFLSSGSKFGQSGPPDSSPYEDDEFEGSNRSYSRNSFEGKSDFPGNSFNYNAPGGKPPFDSKNKLPGLMDGFDPSIGPPTSLKDLDDKGFSQRNVTGPRSRFEDAQDDRSSDRYKSMTSGSLNNAGSLLRPSYLLEKKEALERLRSSAGLAPSSGSGGFSSSRSQDGPNPISRDSSLDDGRPRGLGQFDEPRGRDTSDEPRGRELFDDVDSGPFDGPRGREPFDEPRGHGQFDEPRGLGLFNAPRGRGQFDEPRGRGQFDEPRGRGQFDEPRGRGQFDEPRGRGQFDEPRGHGQFDEPRGRGLFNDSRGRGHFDEPRGRGQFDEPRDRGLFDEPKGRGKFEDSRGRGHFDGPRGRGGFDGPRGAGFDEREQQFDVDDEFENDKYQRPPFRESNQPPNMDRNKRDFGSVELRNDRNRSLHSGSPKRFEQDNFDENRKWSRPAVPPVGPPSRFDPPPVRPRREELEFFRPAKVIDYNHKRLEPEFFEPVTITDYGHGKAAYSSRSAVYDKGAKRGELEDILRQRRSRSPRRSPHRRNSPLRRNSPHRNSPPRRSPRRSPMRRSSPRRSPGRKNSPRRSPSRRSSPSNDKNQNKKSDSKKFDKDLDKSDSQLDQNKTRSESEDKKDKSSNSKTPAPPPAPSAQVTVSITDILEPPGRNNRPPKIVIILRGLPGSGKTYVAKLIKDKEVEMGGSPPRILSLDDYFVTEVEKEEIDPETNKKVTVKKMEYVYEAGMEVHYRSSLVKVFKKTIQDGYFPFIIVDSIFEKISHYSEILGFGKSKGFKNYICEMDMDAAACFKRNIHNRTESEIKAVLSKWEKTPNSQTLLDVRPLLQSDSITEVNMEDISDEPEKDAKDKETNVVEVPDEEAKDSENPPEDDIPAGLFTSKWELMEFSEEKKDRLDGLRKKRSTGNSIRDWLQLNSTSAEDELYKPEGQLPIPGKKRVRWADMEERNAVAKMRNLGFVVGQTDWSRMMDPSQGENKLTQIKYF